MIPNSYGSGDFYVRIGDHAPRPILTNSEETLTLSPEATPYSLGEEAGSTAEILIRLQRPYVDPQLCIGCGVCEHECPVQGRRAIRITAENESRQRAHKLILR
jgi:ferredoxin